MLVHCSISYDRVISSKLTRVFFNIGGVSVESDASSHHHQGLSAMVGLQGKASTYISGGDVIFFFFLNLRFNSNRLT